MKISKRLKMIADMITNINVVDIGCDHALLDIYLTLNGKICIASDISNKVLDSAKNNIKKYNLSDKINVVLSNGTNNIDIPSNSSLVISGMGTHTIIEILDSTNHKNINELIIQSNNELELLRKSIIKLGYYIEDENAILDKNKFYVIIKFKKGHKKYTKKELLLGPILKDKQYYKYLLGKNNEILKHLNLKHLSKIFYYKKINKLIKQKLNN